MKFKTFHEAAEKLHPNADVYHEITWWISRPMTLAEWIVLDDAMCDAFEKAGLEDEYMGVAGPIPFDVDGKTHPEAMEEQENERTEEPSQISELR